MENKTMKNIAYSGVFAGALLGAYLMGERSANNQPSSYENRHQAVEKTKDSNYLEEKVSSKEEKPYSEPEDEPSFAGYRVTPKSEVPISIRGLDSLLHQGLKFPEKNAKFTRLRYLTGEYGRESFRFENDNGDRLILMKGSLDEDGYLRFISNHDGMIGSEKFSKNLSDYDFNGVVKINKKGIIFKNTESSVYHDDIIIKPSTILEGNESRIYFEKDGIVLRGTTIQKKGEYYVGPEDAQSEFKVVLGNDWSRFLEDKSLDSINKILKQDSPEKIFAEIKPSHLRAGAAISEKDSDGKRNIFANPLDVGSDLVIQSDINNFCYSAQGMEPINLRNIKDDHPGLSFGKEIEKIGNGNPGHAINNVYSFDRHEKLHSMKLPNNTIAKKENEKDQDTRSPENFAKAGATTIQKKGSRLSDMPRHIANTFKPYKDRMQQFNQLDDTPDKEVLRDIVYEMNRRGMKITKKEIEKAKELIKERGLGFKRGSSD